MLDGYSTPGQWAANVWQNGKYVGVGYGFMIDHGALKDTAAQALASIVISANLKGQVFRLDNSKYSRSAEWMGFNTPLKNRRQWQRLCGLERPEQSFLGADRPERLFNVMLAPGKYMAVEAGGMNFWMKPEIAFQIGSDNQLVSGANAANGMLLVQPDIPNFTGTVYQDSAKTIPLKYGQISIKPADAKDDDWSSAQWINTDRQRNIPIQIEGWLLEDCRHGQ